MPPQKKHFLYAYIRLSPNDKEHGQIETQKKAVADFCKNKFKKEPEFFIDENVSGSTPMNERENGFKKMMEKITEIRTNSSTPIHLVTYHPDRFSRDDLIFNLIIDFLSKKCVKIYYVSEEGEGDPMILKFKSIIAEQERRNTIRRINQYYEVNNNWDKRVGFGWDYDVKTRQKTKNSKEYPVLEKIKTMYEDGEMLCDIATELNDLKLFKRDGKEWNTTNLDFVVTKNGFEWAKNNKNIQTAFEKDNCYWSENGENKVFIKDFEKAVKEFDTEEDFYKSFGTQNIYVDGKKVTTKVINKYFVKSDSKEEIEKKLIERIIFWLNEQKYYSNDEITKKIKSEFPSLEKLSNQSIWRRIKKAKTERDKILF